MNLNKPSKNKMDRITALWEQESSFEYYKQQANALKWLFETYPNNTNLNEIIIKVACLDRLYSTNITKSYKIPQVAQHILNLNFDDRVQKGDITLIDDIANLGRSGEQGGAKILSFASKYCVWHNDYIYKKDDFVIFDSIVKTKLKEFNEQFEFFTPKFSKKDLKDYKKYKEILERFREFFGLKCSFRDIDRYLWRLEKLRQIGKY